MQFSPAATQPHAGAAWRVAFVLTAANSLAFVDRQVLALFIQPIQNDLKISDTEISLLFGFSFSIVYIAFALPLARLADRANRRNIIAASVVAWSLMTGLCGLARSFGALFAARIGVAAGEAGLSPAAYSILSDYFSRERLPAAISLYSTGVYLGSGMALILGGVFASLFPPELSFSAPVLGDLRGWQIAFLILGALGVLLAPLVMTVREPERQYEQNPDSAGMAELIRHVRKQWRAYFGICMGFSMMIFVGYGSSVWIPAFLERKYGWTAAEIGATYGPLVVICGCLGAISGGFFARELHKRGYIRANLIAALVGFTVLTPLTILFPLASTGPIALAVIGMMNYFAASTLGGGYSALMDLTPNRMRASVAAVYLLIMNIVAVGFGPTVVALVTDYGFADPARLPEALSLTALWASPLALAALWFAFADYRPNE